MSEFRTIKEWKEAHPKLAKETLLELKANKKLLEALKTPIKEALTQIEKEEKEKREERLSIVNRCQIIESWGKEIERTEIEWIKRVELVKKSDSDELVRTISVTPIKVKIRTIMEPPVVTRTTQIKVLDGTPLDKVTKKQRDAFLKQEDVKFWKDEWLSYGPELQETANEIKELCERIDSLPKRIGENISDSVKDKWIEYKASWMPEGI